MNDTNVIPNFKVSSNQKRNFEISRHLIIQIRTGPELIWIVKVLLLQVNFDIIRFKTNYLQILGI